MLSLLVVGFGGTALAESVSAKDTYIVVYKRGTDITNKVGIEQARGNEVSDYFRVALKGLVAELGSDDVERLRDDPGVVVVERDGEVEALGLAPRDSSSASWGLDRSDQRSLPLDSRVSTASNGFGVDAYVIDTGVRSDHSEFTGRMAPGYNSLGDGSGTLDCNGHGTHVAGTIAGSSYGLAPGATVVPVKVLDCWGSGSWSSVIDGINWSVANHQAGTPAVINMSLGGDNSSAINQAVQGAVADGISVAVAAGNSNSNACNFSPASAPSALTVAATTGSDRRASFSNWGTCVDVFAPGQSITSAWIGSDSANSTISGTSMASPHVAGAAALVLSANRSLTPAQVASEISTSATTGMVTDPQTGTPNRLLYAGDPAVPNPNPEPEPQPEPPAPANDAFANAAALSLAGITGTNVAATHESGEPSHVSSSLGSAKSVWYRWTAPASGTLTLSTEGSDFDTLLAVYRGSSVNSLEMLAGNDDAVGVRWSQVSLPVTAGAIYRVAVDGWRGESGSIAVSGSFTPDPTNPEPPPPPAPVAPVNDAFASATELDLAGVAETTVQATREDAEPLHVYSGSGSRRSIWHRWTAPASGTLELSTLGSSFDTLLAVYSGQSLDSLVPLAGSDDYPGGLWSRVSLAVSSGTTYRIAVDGWQGASGSVELAGVFTPDPIEPEPPVDPTPEPPAEPEDPVVELPDGVLAPAPGNGFVLGVRGVTGQMSCSIPEGATESNDCQALLRLRTSAGSSRRGVQMDVGMTRSVTIPITARMRRHLRRVGTVQAQLTVITVDGRETHQVTLRTLRAASQRKRALAVRLGL